jgi:phosphatidylglycerophosphate synthase
MSLVRTDTPKPLTLRHRPNIGTPLGAFALASAALVPLIVALTQVLPASGIASPGLAVVGFTIGVAASARALHRGYPHARLGACNVITLLRLALTMALLGPLVAGAGPSWPILTVAFVALLLDGADGWFARRHGTASVFGARFDLEVDSALALVLAVGAATAGTVGPAAILLALPRYLFAGGMWLVPWMRADLPPRFSRKTVCVVQLGTLIALQAPILPAIAAAPLVAVALALLAWSFTVDLAWLWRHRA